eukprot:c6630_g1_i2 orf=185-622(-)
MVVANLCSTRIALSVVLVCSTFDRSHGSPANTSFDIDERRSYDSHLSVHASGFVRPGLVHTAYLGGDIWKCKASCFLSLSSNACRYDNWQQPEVLRHYVVRSNLAIYGLNAGHYDLSVECSTGKIVCYAVPRVCVGTSSCKILVV